MISPTHTHVDATFDHFPIAAILFAIACTDVIDRISHIDTSRVLDTFIGERKATRRVVDIGRADCTFI